MFYWNKKPRVFSSDIILTELFLCLYIRANGGWGSCWFVEVIWRVLGSLWHSVSWFPVGFFAGTRRVSLPWETSRGQDGSVMCVLSLRKTPLTWSLQRPQTPLSEPNVARDLIKQSRKTGAFTHPHSCFKALVRDVFWVQSCQGDYS